MKRWTGYWQQNGVSVQHPFVFDQFSCDTQTGQIVGSGNESAGKFTIEGTCTPIHQLHFSRTVFTGGENKTVLNFWGMLNYAKNEMIGDWGFETDKETHIFEWVGSFRMGDADLQKKMCDVYGRQIPASVYTNVAPGVYGGPQFAEITVQNSEKKNFTQDEPLEIEKLSEIKKISNQPASPIKTNTEV